VIRQVAIVLLVLVAGCGGQERRATSVDGGATLIREQRIAPRLLDLNLRSRALGTTAKVLLMTPVGWSPGDSRRWPVLYLLHGCCDTYESWTRSTDVERMPQLRDVLVVMPEAGDVGFYSDWLDGPAWERFHLNELRRLLEREYGAGTRRAVAGLSMGGLGAMAYAARHPGFFAAAASFSGVLHPLADAANLMGLFSNYAPDPRAIWGDPQRRRDVWAHHDPTELADRLRGTRLFVSSGNGEPGPFEPPGAQPDPIEQSVMRQSRAFVDRLRRLKIPVEADFYGAGVHSWPYWQRELERVLPLLAR